MRGREPALGVILGERYRLEKELGQGAMGCVWQAEHLTLHSRVAVKTVTATLSLPDAAARFAREAQAAAQLKSPHVVRTFDYGVDDGVAFLVMELLEGETLRERLRREGTTSAPFTCKLVSQVARGLGEAHAAGIVHRDLKPDNIFLARNDDDVIVKVLDFGIAKSLRDFSSSGVQTGTGMVLGTLPYMSPEQFEQNGQVGVASDVWALSVVAFECLVGRVPFAGQSVPALIKAICHDPAPTPSSLGAPRAFDAWFAKGTALEPARRFASVKEAAVQLRRALGVTESAALGAAPLPKTAPTARVNEGALSPGTAAPLSVSNASAAPRVKLALAVVVIAVGSIGVGAWWFAARGGSGAPELARELETSRPGAALTEAPPSVTPLPSQGSPIPPASAVPSVVPSAAASATAASAARVPGAPPQPAGSGATARQREKAPSAPPDFIDAPSARPTPSPRSSAPPRDDKAPLFL